MGFRVEGLGFWGLGDLGVWALGGLGGLGGLGSEAWGLGCRCLGFMF